MTGVLSRNGPPEPVTRAKLYSENTLVSTRHVRKPQQRAPSMSRGTARPTMQHTADSGRSGSLEYDEYMYCYVSTVVTVVCAKGRMSLRMPRSTKPPFVVVPLVLQRTAAQELLVRAGLHPCSGCNRNAVQPFRLCLKGAHGLRHGHRQLQPRILGKMAQSDIPVTSNSPRLRFSLIWVGYKVRDVESNTCTLPTHAELRHRRL